MNKKMIPKVLLVLLLYGLISFYIGWHVVKFLNVTIGDRYGFLFWILFVMVSLAFIVGMLSKPKWLLPLFRFLKVTGAIYFSFIGYLLMLLVLSDFLFFILSMEKINTSKWVPVVGWGIIATLVAITVVGLRNAWSPIVQRYQIEVAKPSNLSNLKIVAVSDIHLGSIVGNRYLNKMVRMINNLDADVVLLVGDVLDHSIEPFLRNEMHRPFTKIKSRYGIFAVLGNHEYYAGHLQEYLDKMAEADVQILLDQVVQVDNTFYIAGRKDVAARTFDPKKRISVADLLVDLDHDKPIILIDHQPVELEKAVSAGADIQFSGHTHRAQQWPYYLLTNRIFEIDWGYKLKETMHVLVSSGYGTWGPPVRTGSRSEILEVNVTFVGAEKDT